MPMLVRRPAANVRTAEFAGAPHDIWMTDAVARDAAHNGSTATPAPDAAAVASRQGSTSGDVPALLLGALFDQLHHGVVVQDAAGRLQAANRAARDALGIDPEAIRESTPAL